MHQRQRAARPLSLPRAGGASPARIRRTTATPIRGLRRRPSARAAARAGAPVLENTEVVAVEKVGEDFRVDAADGRVFRAPAVLISAGAWGNRLSAQLRRAGAARRPRPADGRDRAGALRDPPGRSASRTTCRGGRLLPPGQARQHRVRRRHARTGLADIRRAYVLPREHARASSRRSAALAPALGQSQHHPGLERHREAICPTIFRSWGRAARVPGLYYAFGFCGHGFQLGPGRRRRHGRADRHRQRRRRRSSRSASAVLRRLVEIHRGEIAV